MFQFLEPQMVIVIEISLAQMHIFIKMILIKQAVKKSLKACQRKLLKYLV